MRLRQPRNIRARQLNANNGSSNERQRGQTTDTSRPYTFAWLVAMVVGVGVLGSLHRYEDLQAKVQKLQVQLGETRALLGGGEEILQVEQETTKAANNPPPLAAADSKSKLANPASPTTTATTNSSLLLPQDRQVHFMGFPQLHYKDAFSASWLQRKQDFLEMEFDRIKPCEDAAFRAYGLGGEPRSKRLRMTLDWLDFSVEHLSKWWKTLFIFRQPQVYQTALNRFDNYLANAPAYPLEPEQSFSEVISVIAFQPYKDDREHEQAYNLTIKSLAATVESLRRAGFGRVVVVGENKDDYDNRLVQETFRQLKKVAEPSDSASASDATITKIGHMEVGFAPYNVEDAKTNHIPKNIPRATLLGLKEAFDLLARTRSLSQEEENYTTTWLGDDKNKWDHWKYVYLTEPDSILQSRPNTLKQLKKQLDQGMILTPHRLQPIPHEADARGSKRQELFLPEKEFPNVMDLDSIGSDGGDACCDAHLGPDHKPGNRPNDPCGYPWYMCEMEGRTPKEQRTFKRIKPYPLIRLQQGTGIVSLASGEHGRPCIPKKHDVCLPPVVPN